jgi:hypothetical protein
MASTIESGYILFYQSVSLMDQFRKVRGRAPAPG